jgi:16S rRNA (cytosine1402-N4)-methyltransferase
MRMDPSSDESAAQWLARADERDIEMVLRDYGEERHARRIARAIVRERSVAPIETTGRLAAVVSAAMPGAARRAEPGQHPATRAFQALRMQVNQELEELDAGLEQALDALCVGGRLAVISFHSLEDRRVKRFMRNASRPPLPSRHLPLPASIEAPRLTKVSRAIGAGAEEVARNPRARSARLRFAEKCR